MPFHLKWTPQALEEYERIRQAALKALASRRKSGKAKPSKQEGLFGQTTKAIRLLADNPRHPGLNTHEYQSLANPYVKKGKVFGAYAQNNTPGAYRIFWCYGSQEGQITILAITPHP